MKKKILFYGDSNTFGYDPRIGGGGRYPESVRWTALVRTHLASEWDVLDNGLNGRAVPNLRHFPEGPSYLDRMIAEAVPLTCFAVMLGTNNLFLRRDPDAEVTAEAMRLFLLYIRSQIDKNRTEDQTSCRILLIAPPYLRVSAASELDPARCLEESIKMNKLYRSLAEDAGYAFCDAEAWDIETSFDGVHFSEQGHAQFAAQIEQVLSGLF